MTESSTSPIAAPGTQPQAVIDIGSNTIRLVIFGGDPRVPGVLLNEKVQAKLGRGMNETGKLSAKAMSAALKALRRFALVLNARAITQVHTVATAAVRDAANGPEFLAHVKELGLNPRLLSGEEEALTSARGVAGAFPDAKGVVADLGGGSLELVHIAGWTCEHGSSLPLGTLRLPALRTGNPAKFRRETAQLIAQTGSRCQPGEALYLVGGSFRALARYHLHITHSPLDDPHGFVAAAGEISKLCRVLQRMPPVGPVPGISAARLNALQDTAALLEPLIAATMAERLIFSGWGLREGIILQSLPDSDRQRDAFTSAAMAFAARHGVIGDLPGQTAQWIAAAVTPGSDPAKALPGFIALALALRAVEPNLRSATALNWALHKRWIGLDGAGRAMLAACLLASANRTVPDQVRQLASRQEIQSATAWGLAMRLCWRLTGFSAALLPRCQIAIAHGQLHLRLDQDVKDLATELTAKDLADIAKNLGLQAIISAE